MEIYADTITKIPGDGNCLYRAIAYQINDLFGITFDHLAIRRDLAKYVEDNQHNDNIHQAIRSNLNDTLTDLQTQINKYLQAQYKEGTWGGTDILIAAAEYYSINVKIFQGYPLKETIQFSPKNNDAAGCIGLIFNGNHYDCFKNHLGASSLNPTQKTESSDECTPEEITDETGYRLIRPKPHYTTIKQIDNINIATWNVRGAATLNKKADIDSILEDKLIHIACLQETHLKTGSYKSKHYLWSLCENRKRGLAILIRKNCGLTIKWTKSNTNNMAALIYLDNQTTLFIVNIRVSNSTSAATNDLAKFIHYNTGRLQCTRRLPKPKDTA